MSFLLSLDESRLAEQLIPILEAFEADIEKAEPLFKFEGEKLERVARVLPYNQQFYNQRAQEAKQLVKWLENHRDKIEAKLTKNYLNGQRAYGARETATLIGGEKDMVDQKQLIIEATLVYEKLDAIVDGFRQMGWMLGNITKLHVASIQDVVL